MKFLKRWMMIGFLLGMWLVGLVACTPATTDSDTAEQTAVPCIDDDEIEDTEGEEDEENEAEDEDCPGDDEDEAGDDEENEAEDDEENETEDLDEAGDIDESDDVETAVLQPQNFVTTIDNPYMPLLVGAKFVYEGQTEEGLERTEIEVLPETKEIMGITATIVRDTVYLDGVIIEDTFDWFAQDKEGNVWYLGEDVSNYENGQLVDKEGSWEAGVDGAVAGIVMYADPAAHIGETYQQEYYQGKAEDRGQVLSVNESIVIPYGSFDHVLQTLETNPLEPDVQEHKFYAQGIGMIQAVNLTAGESEQLVEMLSP